MFEEFLVLPEIMALQEYVRSNECHFHPSEIVSMPRNTSTDLSYRRSMVTLETGPFGDLIRERIRFYMPRIVEALRHRHFDLKRIEAQITASTDGDFFKIHNDNTHADAPWREITYVYFFHREPKPFTGGELLIYDARSDGNEVVPDRVRSASSRNRTGSCSFRALVCTKCFR